MSWLDDGFSTTVYFANQPSGVTFYLKEKEVTPPGIDWGGANDTTTMRNTAWRTNAPKKLKSLTEFNMSCKYDPQIFSQILTMGGTITIIVITFPDNSTYRFYGWIDKVTPDSIVEGEMAMANVVVIPSNQTAADVEVAPVWQAGG